jgi:hypothetical protein
MKHLRDIEQMLWPQTPRAHAPVSRGLVPVYRVGELFRPGYYRWPEGAQFSVGPGGHEITLFRSNIDQSAVEDIRQGESEFALIVENPLIVMSYRFGRSIPWDDVPFSWHLQPASWRAVPTVHSSCDARALLWISLVGAEDGVICAQRGVTLSPGFTRSLHTAIRTQAMTVFDPQACTSAIAKVFLDQRSAFDRLSQASARTMGNE